jgi:hypothetical protein
VQDCTWFSNRDMSECYGQCFANLPSVPELEPVNFLTPVAAHLEPLVRCTLMSGLVFALSMDDSSFSRKLLQQARPYMSLPRALCYLSRHQHHAELAKALMCTALKCTVNVRAASHIGARQGCDICMRHQQVTRTQRRAPLAGGAHGPRRACAHAARHAAGPARARAARIRHTHGGRRAPLAEDRCPRLPRLCASRAARGMAPACMLCRALCSICLCAAMRQIRKSRTGC